MDYEKAYKEALERARDYHKRLLDDDNPEWAGEIETMFPELKESEDEKIRKALIEYFNEQCDMSDWNGVYGYQVVAWLEKQGEPNPYSGTSFKYNGHTWGMCARDNGVDIGYDKQFIVHINPIQEKDEFDNFNKAISPEAIDCDTGDFITINAPNHGI